MSSETEFVSPAGTIKAGTTLVYNFVSDIRNFSRFIPEESVKNWVADAESCSFEINPVGSVTVKLTEKNPASLVKFEGVALQNTAFRIWVQLKDSEPTVTRFRIVLRAELNPFYKMMASNAINNFLEKLVKEIEKVEGWDGFTSDTQSP
jgi:carbon monoxide dehydrogenase subunit G